MAQLDLTDPVVLSSIVQTTVLTFTLIVFILQFRSQQRTTKEAAYESVLNDYTDGIRMLVDVPELRNIPSQFSRGQPTESLEEGAIRNYFLYMYGVLERIFLLYRRKWIDEQTWTQWSAFLETLAKNQMFVRIHRASEGMYDKQFLEYVSFVLDKGRK